MKYFSKLVIPVICSSVFVSLVQAEEFDNKVRNVLSKHHLIKMVDYDLKTSEEQVKSTKAGWYPTIALKASYGNDKIKRELGEKGSYNPLKVSVEAKQLIYDFGLIEKRIESSKKVSEKEKVENDLQRQNLLLATVESHLGLIKSNILYKYSKKSEKNIKEQTKLENTRVEMGKGYTTDVLQSKAQLLGAEANIIFAEGQKSLSEYRYNAVFLEEISNLDELKAFYLSENVLPKSITELEAMIIKQNPDLLAAEFRAKVANSEKNIVEAETYSPSIYADLSRSYSEELDGVNGNRHDAKALLTFDWKFNLGMQGIKNINAAKFATLSALEKSKYVRVQALEEGKRAWNSFLVAKKRTKYLENQVSIQEEFLRLAREEREMGRRSLIDILNGETALLRVKGDYASAKIEEVISSFKILRSVGTLNLKLFENNITYISQNQLFN